jgi:hypothetical protein
MLIWFISKCAWPQEEEKKQTNIKHVLYNRRHGHIEICTANYDLCENEMKNYDKSFEN